MFSHFKKTAVALVLGGLLASASTAGTLIIEGGADIVAPPGGMVNMMGGNPIGLNGWVARETDGSVLNVLLAWSAAAGWTFRMEHWTVDNDYPVQGGVRFDGDYQTAVRSLLETTKQSQLPIQPCFYSNRVLRVVPQSELCDRGQSAQAPIPVSMK